MAAKTFNVKIDGYWRDVNKGSIPAHSGVYFVYECTYNPSKDGKGTVTLKRLLYIGESQNVNERIQDHEKYVEWANLVRHGNTLCFATGPVESNDRIRVEAAYIFEHKPPLNTEYRNDFPFNTTSVHSSGKTGLLHTDFIVQRTP
ncbi:hypothetical protein SLH46_11250 [Draconibacterium sp. IB214405]|uniref:hypothetical protein n=1 Tax=Draconibacterium sp. IB214405 TaxID=3097352 RepID=UPI002A113005|nr:hypothetical protein [Draconibacterium sp. IB214405]MDX8339763.1 hypothetical protein [Draconibacterium sp. IB214405]